MARVIAIDGPAASGKSTVASRVSEELNIPYINTGNMYRTVAWYFLQHSFTPGNTIDETLLQLLDKMDFDYRKNESGVYEIFVDGSPVGSAIRTPLVTSCVSQVSAVPEVRTWLLGKQRYFAGLGLIVMEGRDIGTVVFPDAQFKFFVTASPEARARRRLAQAGETMADSTVESVAAEIAERDRLDSSRKTAPLRQADDAELVDTTDMTIKDVVDLIVSKVKQS